jgi:hypothetical protein
MKQGLDSKVLSVLEDKIQLIKTERTKVQSI